MKVPSTLIVVGAALALSACSKKESDPEPTASTAVTNSDDAELASDGTESLGASGGSAATSEPADTKASETVSVTQIPTAIRGRWGMVPKDCTSKLGDAKGLLTVSASQLKFYEAVAKIGKVKEADDNRIRATFTYSGEGQTWTQDVVLDAQDGGKTLIRRDYGPDALPGPQKYIRCS